MAIRKDVKKEVRYLNKDFSSYRNNLINFAKNYFPNTYNDFNESSPGMMFIEMASYVGDVLSFYLDRQYKETLLKYAEDRKNVIALAENFGYKVKTSSPATVYLEVFCVVPSDNTDTSNPKPDYRYAPILKSGFSITSTQNNVKFRSVEDVNFREESVYKPRVVTIYEKSGNLPTKWLLKKIVQAQSTEVQTITFGFSGDPKKFDKRTISNTNVIEIVSVTDSDGNKWYEVPYLAQDTIFDDVATIQGTDTELTQYSDDAPYLLKLKKTSRRFITRVNANQETELIFGAGISDNPDEEIIPNPTNIGTNLPGSAAKIDYAFDPANFLYTRTYGQVPTSTTLTIQYSIGGGVTSNVGANTLTALGSMNFNSDIYGTDVDDSTVAWVHGSVAVNNPDAATGGRSAETIEEIRHNALAYFATQQRAVTKEDYMTRVYSLPSKYGSIAKCFIIQDDQLQQADDVIVTSDNTGNGVNVDGERNQKLKKQEDDSITPNRKGRWQQEKKMQTKSNTKRLNPLALNFYCLGYDANKQLTALNTAVKQNLKTYLSQYRILTDAINIKDAYVINLGIDFEISVLGGFNKRDVVARCIDELRREFNIDKWQLNQPIVKGDLIYKLSLIEGVQNVISLDFDNKYDLDSGYSGNVYNITEALRNEILYPSADPSIFEIKYPNRDIRGKAV